MKFVLLHPATEETVADSGAGSRRQYAEMPDAGSAGPRIKLEGFYGLQRPINALYSPVAPFPRIRPDEYNAQVELPPSEEQEAAYECCTEDGPETSSSAILATAPSSTKMLRHKSMNAEQQAQTIETLKAHLLLYLEKEKAATGATFRASQEQANDLRATTLQQALIGENYEPVIADQQSPVSTSSDAVCINPRNEGMNSERSGKRRGRTKQSKSTNHPKKLRKGLNEIEKIIKPETRDLMSDVQELGDHRLLSSVINAANTVLDGLGEVDAGVKELLQIEEDWKAAVNPVHKRLVSLYERYGVIPMGGVRMGKGMCRAEGRGG